MDTTTTPTQINTIFDETTTPPTRAGAISTAATRSAELYSQLTQLVADNQAWESNHLNTTNDALYVLLERCYRIYENAIMSTVDSALLQVAINDYFNLNNLKIDPNAHTLNNIVKLVFGVDRKRASAYAVALRIALADKIKAADLPNYIRNAGGIEEVRRKGKGPGSGLTIEQRAAKAKSWLSAEDFGAVRHEALTAELDAAKVGNQHLLIVTQLPDGSLRINGLISTAGLVQQALAAHYNQSKEKHASHSVENTETDGGIALNAAIATAAGTPLN